MTWDDATVEGARRQLLRRWEAEEGARRERLERLRQEARRCADVLASQFGARRVVLFGSVATGLAGARSDLDLAVEGLQPDRYFEVLGRLAETTPVPVDLVLLEEAPESLVERLAREGVPLHGE
jgi:uncharacterized protein